MRKRSRSFIEQHFNPYLNFHRPCGVPEVVTNAKGKQRRAVPLVRDAVGDPAAVAGLGAPPTAGPDADRTGANRRARRATRKLPVRMQEAKREAVCRIPTEEERMKDDRGNDRPWTPRKTKSRFSLGAHSPWKSLRDSHIPTAATKQWKSGKPKTGFPLSTATGCLFRPNSERRPGGGASLLLQAHCSVRKCSVTTVNLALGAVVSIIWASG